MREMMPQRLLEPLNLAPFSWGPKRKCAGTTVWRQFIEFFKKK